jgi:lysophospholipase L1-like esterase
MSRTLKRVALATSAALLTLVAAEIAGRVFIPLHDPGQATEDAMEASPILGWTPKAGETQAFGISGRSWINTERTRNPEFEPRQPDELRLLTLGDSTIYGVLVADEEVFSAVAAERLSRELGRPVTGYNGGIPGYSSEQSLRLLTHNLADLDFDVLIIATQWSDSQMGEPDHRHFPLRFPELQKAFWKGGIMRLVQLGDAPPPPPPQGQHGPGQPGQGGQQITWELNELEGERRVPIGRYRSNLHALAEEARDRGAEPVYLVLPSDRDLRRQELESPRPAYREVLREVAAEEGALLIEGAEPFVGGPASLLRDDVHPSASGHRLLGETVAEALLPTLR